MKTLSWLVGGALLSIAVAACGGSSSSNTSGSKSNITRCMTSGSSTVTCTGSEAYSSCLESKCSSAYKKCFGDGYQQGNFGGSCATYTQCANKAADPCKPTGCTPDSACQSCLINDIGSCTASASCPLPQCGTTGSAGTSTGSSGKTGGSAGTISTAGTCADLMACCAKITDANLKSACTSAYDSAKASGDQVCGAALSALKSYCP